MSEIQYILRENGKKIVINLDHPELERAFIVTKAEELLSHIKPNGIERV